MAKTYTSGNTTVTQNSNWTWTMNTWWQTYTVSRWSNWQAVVTNSSWQTWTFSWNTFVPSSSSSSSSSSGGSSSWWGWGSSSHTTATTPQYTYCDANWWAYQNGQCVWAWDIVVWWATTTPGGWWGWSNNNNNNCTNNCNNNNCDNHTPTQQQNNYPDYSTCFGAINDYMNNFQNSVTWDITWLRNLMNEQTTMFQSKLDAQLQAQKELENKFNLEWDKISNQMDSNTREQKARLDQMEKTYLENLTKTQQMVEEYYTSTREALEQKASSASAAAASELWSKWLNSAVVESAVEGKARMMREQINEKISEAAASLKELNQAYADFEQQIYNNHGSLNDQQINFLKEWLNKKQELWNQAQQYQQEFISNVYQPIESYYKTMSDEYTSQAKTDYSRVLSDESYAKADVDQREATLFNRLTAMLEQYWDISALSDFDWELISRYANDRSISQTKALTLILKWVLSEWKNQDSALYDAVSSYSASKWTNVSTSNPTSNTKTNNEPSYSDDSDTRLANITENLSKYAKSNPELFADRNKFNTFFKYDQRSDKQKAVLDEYFNAFNQANKWNNTSNSSTKLYHLDPEKWDDFKTSMWKIKNSWDTNKGKMQQVDKYIEELQHDIQVIKSQWSGPWLQNTVALYEKEIENAQSYRKELKNLNMEDLALSTDVWNWKTFEEYDKLMKEVYNNSKMSASQKLEQYKRILTWANTMKKNYSASTTDNNYEKTQKLINYQKMIDECNKYIKMYSK